jgi:cell wall-associated NlpC family hydrolase
MLGSKQLCRSRPQKNFRVCIARRSGFGVRPAFFQNVPSLSYTAVLSLALTTSIGTVAIAEEKSGDKSRGDFGITLQPFAFGSGPARRAQAIRVAYYTPRAQPVTSPRTDADNTSADDDIDTLPRMNASHPMIAGNRAVLRNGMAYAPSQAPQSVKNAMWAVNSLRHKPYVWGGGHGSFHDHGYDCSGSVSFALHYAGLLATPIPSSDFCRYGARGRGRWITVYSRRGHTFAVIAGLRLDTTDLRYGGDVGPRWYVEGRDTGGFEVRHPVGL